MIAFDVETTGLNPRLNNTTHVGTYDGNDFRMFAALDAGWIFNSIQQEDLIMHNGKFDRAMIKWNHGLDLKWKYDTMLLSQLYDSRVKHKLDTLGEKYIGQGKWGDKKVLSAIKRGEFWLLPEDVQVEYLRRDCQLTWRLCEFFRERLSPRLMELYLTFDRPVSLALSEIERNGFTIDEEKLNEYRELLTNKLVTSKLELQHYFGSINLNSPKQLLQAIRNTTNIQLTNTSERSLSVAAKYDKRIGKIFEYRELFKYLNTYIDGEGKNGKRKGLMSHLYKGKVYPQFHLAGDYHTSTGHGTETGRTSSSDPNLQNQPRPGNGPVNIRSLFIPSSGHTLLAFDYSQLELKVCAYLSGEKNLLDGDLHQQAANILKVDRSTAKNINFAKLYNAQRPKIQYMSGGSRYVDKYINWFEGKFPKATKWCENKSDECERTGKIETYLGRVRYMEHPEAGPNSIVQGTAGDIGKEATWRVHEKGYRVLGIIHDEVLVEIPKEDVNTAVVEIPRIMTEGLIANGDIHQTVNLGVSVKQGENWGEMKECKYVEA